MRLRLVAAFIIIVCGAFQIAGAEVLTLDQCINIALENNYNIRAARNAYSSSRAQLYNAWGDILPSISVSANAGRNWPGQFDINTLTRRTDSYSGALSFNLTYGGLGVGTYAGINRANHAKGSSFYGMSSTQASIVQQVKSDYYGVVRAKSLVGVAVDAVKRDQEGLRVAQSRYDLGAASLSDVLKARVQLGNDQLDSVSQVNNYQLGLSTLAFDMGVGIEREIEIVDNLPMARLNLTYEEALGEAMNSNPDYRKAQFDLAVANDARLQAYSNLLPNLSFGLTHRTNVNQLNNLLDFRQPDASYTLYASISFNIFNNFFDYSNIKQARNQALTQSQNLYNTRNNVALSVKQAFLNVAQADEAKKLSDESVASAQEDLNIVKEKYSLGAATILDLLTAEASLTFAQQNQVQATYQYNIAVSQVERALGR
jgi:outer membrane protein